MRCVICGGEHTASEGCAGGTWGAGRGSTVLADSPTPSESGPGGQDLSGRYLGDLLLLRRLGQGGMGTVYLAQAADGALAAVKVLHPALAQDAGLVERFAAEARAASRINHPAIVAVKDLGHQSPDLHYLVMEYLWGHPLSRELDGRPLPLPRVRDILEQVLGGLEAAHVRGVVHRDLKPDNLFVVHEGEREHFKILDFGVAKLLGGATLAGRTVAGTLVGTPEYMAPEQVSGEQVDGRTDLYAVGVIAYRLVTGELPFSGPTLMAVLMAHQQQQPTPPLRRNPTLPPAVSDVILKALAKRPEQRFASAGAFREAWAAAFSSRRSAPAPTPSEVPESLPLAVVPDAPTPAAPRVPTPPPAPLFHLRLTPPGEPGPRRLPVLQRTAGGLLVGSEGLELPLRLRLPATLELPGGEATGLVEVVGQVEAAQARRWGSHSGHWVQLAQASRELHALLAQLAQGAGRSLTPPVADDPRVARLLSPFGPGSEADPYRFLDVAPDAPADRVRARVRELQALLDGLLARPLSTRQREAAEGAAARMQKVAALLGSPPSRVRLDAEKGNWAGVARSISAGLSVGELEAARQDFLARHPAALTRSRIHEVTASSWAGRGRMLEALAEYERALAADPLNLRLHQHYWPLRQRATPPPRSPAP